MILRIGNNFFKRYVSPSVSHKQHGFTFVEIMLTVAILAVGIIGVLRAYTIALGALGATQTYIGEVCLAKNKLVEAQLIETQNKGLSLGESKGVFRDGNQNFDWKEEVTASSYKNLSIIKVTVFNNYSNSAREFSLVSYAQNKE